MAERNFAEAIKTYYSYLRVPDLKEQVSSISIDFVEKWTGQEERYVIDTLTSEIKPRLYSLETAHIIEGFSLPEKEEDVNVDELSKEIADSFKKASTDLKKAIEASNDNQPSHSEDIK
ncbi:hypothetical protein EfsSzw1_147 [Enterococcus phage EfsSzw-1]|uniref:Uncharacterized protein n=1 Tax=Enterococcus phage EfsSzw-1 TaxID=2419745 RepID=A0A411B7M8_9CAUD|nr:hypothetical protein EfsSzw1_147 [Enterococcus phage EfsSzw-1]